MSFQLFYSLPLALFFENSLSKALELLLLFFVAVSTGHTHFQNNEACFSWGPARRFTVIISCKIEEPTRKLVLKRVHLPSFTLKKNLPLS